MRSRVSVTSWAPVFHVRQIGAELVGACLCVFGVALLVAHVGFFTTQGARVLGMTGNGLLAVISLVVGAARIGAGIRGGRTATAVCIGFGMLFIISGLVNSAVLGSNLNRLAFTSSNVGFSLVVGVVLSFTGLYGILGGQTPVAGEELDQDDDLGDTPDRERFEALADAEYAMAEGFATPEQIRLVEEDAERRAAEARREAWERYRHDHHAG